MIFIAYVEISDNLTMKTVPLVPAIRDWDLRVYWDLLFTPRKRFEQAAYLI